MLSAYEKRERQQQEQGDDDVDVAELKYVSAGEEPGEVGQQKQPQDFGDGVALRITSIPKGRLSSL
jgi:hypothetical protein